MLKLLRNVNLALRSWPQLLPFGVVVEPKAELFGNVRRLQSRLCRPPLQNVEGRNLLRPRGSGTLVTLAPFASLHATSAAIGCSQVVAVKPQGLLPF